MKRLFNARYAILGLALALCGAATTVNAETVAARVETNRGFVPRVVTIHAGDVVEFVNTSSMTHSVVADPSVAMNPANVILPEKAAPFNSGDLQPGDTFRHTFTVPGHYRYVCRQHEKFGMIGEIFVQ